MSEAEFDRFADDYAVKLNESIRFSGEQYDYFNLYKLRCLRNWVIGDRENLTILDFGCGVGKLSYLLAAAYPKSVLYGVDVSEKCVQSAQKNPFGLTNLHFSNTLPRTKMFDVIYAANVFHHIKCEDRQEVLGALRAVMNPLAKLAIFEHNPWNPFTRYVVKTCPFDADANLIRLGGFVKIARQAGLKTVQRRYIVFFPRFLAFLRGLEPSLGFFPLGAQYMLVLVR